MKPKDTRPILNYFKGENLKSSPNLKLKTDFVNYSDIFKTFEENSRNPVGKSRRIMNTCGSNRIEGEKFDQLQFNSTVGSPRIPLILPNTSAKKSSTLHLEENSDGGRRSSVVYDLRSSIEHIYRFRFEKGL